MVTKEKKIEKICSFYASEYHLEMIMIPYINKKIDEQVNVEIITEKELSETAKEVIARINIPEKRKKEILKIDWNNNKIEKARKNEKKREKVIFVIGKQNYIKKINKELNKILEKNIKLKVVNCYSLEDIQNNMTEIVGNYTKVLNTTEEKEIC